MEQNQFTTIKIEHSSPQELHEKYPLTMHLKKTFFSEKEEILVENGGISAATFLYDSGVHGLKIKNRRGEVILLPFQGQQIWSCIFDNRNLTMKSMFKQPISTQIFSNNYGGFLLHCGATAMGVPSEKDSHPTHGELPNAPYQKAFLRAGNDEKGCYIGIGGQYNHIEAFNNNYLAEPYIKLYENSTVLEISMSITNLKHSDMELMYLMHINFRPENNSQLIYSAKTGLGDIKVHIIPSDIEASLEKVKFANFLKNLELNPELHNDINPDHIYDPEIVFTLKNYNCDDEGKAHSMQIHPDGFADYVCHRPYELDYGIRWISRTKDEDAMGLLLPATAEHRGYSAEKKKGNIKILAAGKKVEFHVEAGLLAPQEAYMVKNKIEKLSKQEI